MKIIWKIFPSNKKAIFQRAVDIYGRGSQWASRPNMNGVLPLSDAMNISQMEINNNIGLFSNNPAVSRIQHITLGVLFGLFLPHPMTFGIYSNLRRTVWKRKVRLYWPLWGINVLWVFRWFPLSACLSIWSPSVGLNAHCEGGGVQHCRRY